MDREQVLRLREGLYGGRVWSAAEVCQALNVKPATLRSWRIPSAQVGGNTLYREQDVAAFIQARFEAKRKPRESKPKAKKNGMVR